MMVIDVEELIAIEKMLDESIIKIELLRKAWESILWTKTGVRPELTTNITTFHKAEIERLFEDLIG